MPKSKIEDKKELEGKEVNEVKPEVKTEVKEKAESNLLIPLEEYIKVSIHTGTRAITPGMREYVYRRKADGIAILNTNKIDEKIKSAVKFMENYDPKDIILICRRDAAWPAAEAFGKATGIRVFLKYPPGIITNPSLETFFEPKLIIVCDPWLDKNVLKDAIKIHAPVIGLVGTNNSTKNIDLVVPCNNKTGKSLGLILYLFAKLFNEAKGIKQTVEKLDFYAMDDTTVEARAQDNRVLGAHKAKFSNEKKYEKEEDQKKIKALVEKLKEKKKKQAEESEKEKTEEKEDKKPDTE